jgi:hypothetical protein
MSLIATAADRILGAIVPRTSAAANNCPGTCFRQTCYCDKKSGFYFDRCVHTTGPECVGCFQTLFRCK